MLKLGAGLSPIAAIEGETAQGRAERMRVWARDADLRFEPVEFPESEIYYFEPLDERVPVYQRPFTLLQEVVVLGAPGTEEALPELDALTVSGTFDYQACDDRLCYEPVSVPLSFTLDLDLLDLQRANR